MAVNSQLTLAGAKLDVAPALANLHFDFTLCRVEPPEEFRGVGKALSTNRRIEAEEGNQHVIARRLGALFDNVIPRCDELIKAYGTRASEISASTATEQGPRNYGMFAGSAGIDATSLWAAATSGPSAIAVHLLACMLARMWSAAEATSIWVEIVKRRKQEIISQFSKEQPIETGALLSAKQEITREQIRSWDASARAWLRAADAAKRNQQIQLMLILDNLLGPVNTVPDTYSSVMDAWKVSTTQMNYLIQGTAQKAQRGDILLALSCWHLYPDMTIVKPSAAHILQKDPLFPNGGVVTIGLVDNSPGKQTGVYWSLPLAHLRHYGRPVVSEASINTSEQSRLTSFQFMMAVLGCVLGSWRASGDGITKHSNWLSILGHELKKLADNGIQSAENLLVVEGKYTWLRLITEAANTFMKSSGTERSVAAKLVNLGRRYGQDFLGQPSEPIFGLTSSGKWVSALKDDEKRIALLRTIAGKVALCLGIKPHEIFIRYRRNSKNATYEYTTALPIVSLKRKFDHHETTPGNASHLRWLNDGRNFDISTPGFMYSHLNSPLETYRECAIPPINSDLSEEDRTNVHKDFESQTRFFDSKGEIVLARSGTIIDELEPSRRGIIWHEYPFYFGQGTDFTPTNFRSGIGLPSGLPNGTRTSVTNTPPKFTFLWGDISTGALFVSRSGLLSLDTLLGSEKNSNMLYEYSDQSQLDYSKIALHLQMFFEARAMIGDSYETSLRAAATAASVYRNLPGAFIDVRILRRSIVKSGWVMSAMQRDLIKRRCQIGRSDRIAKLLTVTDYAPAISSHGRLDDQKYFTECDFGRLTNEATKSLWDQSNQNKPLELLDLSLPETFACLAMFESGTHDIDPSQLENVMAMSAGDSIYVSAWLVTDPWNKVPESDIRRLGGNIGRPGLAFLVPPSDPMFSDIDLARDWKSLDKELFNISEGSLDDRFKNTTLHLSFTGANVEIAVENRNTGGQDMEAYKLETLVTAYDGDIWVADLDIIKALHNTQFHRVSSCEGHKSSNTHEFLPYVSPKVPWQAFRASSPDFNERMNIPGSGKVSDPYRHTFATKIHEGSMDCWQFTMKQKACDNMVSIDNWLCLLDATGNGLSILRARGNWEARLATTSLSISLGNVTFALPPQVCWECVKKAIVQKQLEQPDKDIIIIA